MDYTGLFMGLALGMGVDLTTDPVPAGKGYAVPDRSVNSAIGAVFVGYRQDYWQVQVEGFTLPNYQTTATNDGTWGHPRTISQDINGHGWQIKLGPRVPLGNFAIHPYLGSAWVTGHNHEWGVWRDCGLQVVQRNSSQHQTWTMGVQLQYQVLAHLSTRIDVNYVPDAVQSHWTGERDYLLNTFGLAYTF